MTIEPGLERMFTIAGNVVLPMWLLLIFARKWVWTQRLATFVVPLLLTWLYVWLLLHGKPVEGAGFRSLAQVQLLFSSPQALLAGWVHYLAFDLFTGAWAARDALKLGIPAWVVAPCLVLTFLFGPVGLSLYLLVRLGMRKQVGVTA